MEAHENEDEDRVTLGSGEVAVTLQLATSKTYEDGARQGRRQSHSRVKRSDSSLTAGGIPDLRRRSQTKKKTESLRGQAK